MEPNLTLFVLVVGLTTYIAVRFMNVPRAHIFVGSAVLILLAVVAAFRFSELVADWGQVTALRDSLVGSTVGVIAGSMMAVRRGGTPD